MASQPLPPEPMEASVEPQQNSMMRCPVEITLKIFGYLDLQSAFNLAEVNKKLRAVFETHRETLVLSILHREMSPMDDLLQYIVARNQDLNIRWGPCLRRRIYHRGKLISEGEDGPGFDEDILNSLRPVILDQLHFRDLIRTYRTVKTWEQWFPQYRFRDAASDCRALRPHELERLRRALYHWMSYARYFHGGLPRPNRFVPDEGSPDIRCRKLRLLSNVELCELNDLWQTVVSIVQLHICPSTEQVMAENDGKITLHEAENLSFGSARWVQYETIANTAIVDTFLKLSPEDIIRFATNRFAYSRDRLVREVRLAYPSILTDRQSLGHALSAVLAERRPAAYISEHIGANHSGIFEAAGGILDYEALDDVFRRAMDDGERRQKVSDWPAGDGSGGRWSAVMGRGRLQP